MADSTNSKPASNSKPGKPGRPPKGETPEIDLSGLTFTEAALPLPPNPFRKPLGDSFEFDKPRATRVPAAALRKVEAMIRRAADELEIGVRIVSEDTPAEDGTVGVTFLGKPRRKRKGKATEGSEVAPAAGETPAAEDTGNGQPTSEPGSSAEADGTGAASEAPEPVREPVAS